MKLKKQVNKKRRISTRASQKNVSKKLDPSEVKEYERNRVHYGNYEGKKWYPETKT